MPVRGRGGEGVKISHLIFADDTLIFCKTNEDQITFLSWLLMWFEAISGLKVNLDKSELFPMGNVENMEELAFELGCKVGRLPSTYLVMSLGAPFKSVAIWDGVEERFHKRLDMWKHQYISKGGRVTLIKSMLSSLPIYLMSILQLQRGVGLRLEQIQRDFLWGGGALVQRRQLVRWATICLDKRKGGLGVKSLSTLNKALLCKWSWRFAKERRALWNQVIRGKYGEDQGGWCSQDVSEGYGVGLWKAIRKFGHLVSSKFSFVVGNVQRVSFWKDTLCGDTPLCVSFPSLFALVDPKEAWMKDVWPGTASGGS